MASNSILQIAIPSPLRRLFDYLPPTDLNNDEVAQLQAGIRIKVPFGRQTLVGILIKTTNKSDFPENKLKPAIEILDTLPLFTPTLFRLGNWAANYYQHPVGEALLHMIPKVLRDGRAATRKTQVIWQLTTQGKDTNSDTLSKAPKQQQALSYLLKNNALKQKDLSETDINRESLKALAKKGLVSERQETMALAYSKTTEEKLQLTHEQQHAVRTVLENNNKFGCYLLEGVTGSGKTEVYLQIIEEVLQQNKQAIVLVPEIGLTPQTVGRFRERFDKPVVALHSGLNDQERMNAWLAAKEGEAAIVIGTRSAIFTPLKNPGIIVVDEEHDTSFKQHEGFKYSGRDLSLVRAQYENIPVLLGSATPSFETLNNVAQKGFTRLPLTQRAGNATAPTVHYIDIRNQTLQEGFSEALIRAITQHIKNGNQVLVFINRRGFAPALMCHECGWIASCHRCDARFTLHKQPPHLHCHHCDATRPTPTSCPSCELPLQAVGYGTERSEQALQMLFPNTPIFRIDRDTTRRKSAMSSMLNRINAGGPAILVGTQMLAKGHHFPNITLVAILNADSGLFSGDFRGQERMGQLLLQVAGRSGRAEKKGEVLIQTHHPDNPLLHWLARHDYQGFAQESLNERRLANLPPYSHLILIRADGYSAEQAEAFLQLVRTEAERLQTQEKTIVLLGPIPAPMERRAGRFRQHLLIESPHRQGLQAFIAALCSRIENIKPSKGLRWTIDVDPQDLF